MKLWELVRLDEYPVYDCVYGFIIAAESSTVARLTAAKQAGDEKDATWIDAARSSCVELTPDDFTTTTVVMVDFNAG